MRSSVPFALKRGTPNSGFSKPVTPGCSSAKLYGLRETSGRFLTSFSVMLRPASTFAVSTTGTSTVTAMVSLNSPTSSCRLTTAV